MAHIALYRSWRPQSFHEIVGQRHITQTLQNSLKEGRFTHAYLFSGPRGTGKTSAARILAKAVNCENGPAMEPCNECSACLRIATSSVMDVVEIDAASNRGVEEIREIRDKVKYAPTEVRRKVYIIDEVHMLTTEAFNALLKTLEEPPAHVMFILATTEPHKLPATIISRCQRFDFRRVSLEEQFARLRFICEQEGIEAESDSLHYIARLSDGGMRDALSVLDQIVSFAGNPITYESVLAITGGIASEQFRELALAIKNNELGAALRWIDNMMSAGKSADKCIENLICYFRDALMIKLVPNSQSFTDRILNEADFADIIAAFSRDQLFRMIEVLHQYQVEMKFASQPQTLFEVAMMKICSLEMEAPMNQAASAAAPAIEDAPLLKERLTTLERQVNQLLKTVQDLAQGAVNTQQTKGIVETSESKPAFSPNAGKEEHTISATGLMRGPITKQIENFIVGKDQSALKQVLLRWSQVLSQVREQKITIYAWLVDGEPVSVAGGKVLLAFKNTIHRETTEKPANKQVIEQVMAQQLGQPYTLATLMLKDWKEALSGATTAPREELKLEQEDEYNQNESQSQSPRHKEEWINEAIEIFGEDMVVIKEDLE